jgi:S-(hydroxymethyl)glutathione dehydrogenase/alcohol dehydrogenase
MEVRGGRGHDPHCPHLLGHEGSGIVVETGKDVSKFKAGDRVILGWIKGEGLDVGGPSYHRGDEKLNAGAVTTFNEYAVVSENRCVGLPADVPMDVAVLFGCAVPTGAGMVINTLQPAAGSSVAVFGLGGIGLSAVAACRLYRCGQIIAVDISIDKLAMASALGANVTVDASRLDPVDEIRRLTGKKGVDFAVEAAGSSHTIEQAFNSVRRGGGLCVFASHPRQGSCISLDPYELICGKRIVGSWGGASNPDRDIPRLLDLYRTGQLPLENLITRRYELDDINCALDDLEHRRVGRPIIEIDPSVG